MSELTFVLIWGAMCIAVFVIGLIVMNRQERRRERRWGRFSGRENVQFNLDLAKAHLSLGEKYEADPVAVSNRLSMAVAKSQRIFAIYGDDIPYRVARYDVDFWSDMARDSARTLERLRDNVREYEALLAGPPDHPSSSGRRQAGHGAMPS